MDANTVRPPGFGLDESNTHSESSEYLASRRLTRWIRPLGRSVVVTASPIESNIYRPRPGRRFLDGGALDFYGRRNWLKVGLSVLSVALLVISGLGIQFASHPSSAHVGPSGQELGTAANLSEPYITNTSQFPTPTFLTNTTDHTSLPKIAYLTVGDIDLYALLYVDMDALGNSWLMFRVGTYNVSMAQQSLLGTGCPSSCPPTIPVEWGAPVRMFDFGDVAVQSDSLATSNSIIAVAATSQNTTYVWTSLTNMGSPGSWTFLTGTQGVIGSDGRVSIGPCGGVLLTTLTAAHLTATTWGNACGPFAAMSERQMHPSMEGSSGALPPSPPPVVLAVGPSCGAQGLRVFINGTNFASGATAAFGSSVVPTSFVSPTQLMAVVPSWPTPPATEDVIVTVNGQSSSPNPPLDYFTMAPPAPCVRQITPTAGPSGTSVKIFGAGFSVGATVQFGTAQASNIRYVSSAELTATAPSGCGVVPVTVTQNGYTSLQPTNDEFTYSAPTVTGLNPTLGPAAGGTAVQVSGASYCSGATVEFGSVPATHVTFVSSTLLQATSPTGAGEVDVTVISGGQTSATNPSDKFTYISLAAPTVTQVVPNAGPAGTVVTIFGTNFSSTSEVDFGAHSAPSVRFVSSTELLALAASAGGTVHVKVWSPSRGWSITHPIDCFTFPRQQILRVVNDLGPTASSISVLGTNFSANMVAYFGTVAASTTYLSPMEVSAVVPAGSGTVNVTLKLDGTVSPITPHDEFTYRSTTPGFAGTLADLPPAYDAAPIWLAENPWGGGYEGILASDVATSAVVFYTDQGGGPSKFTGQSIAGLTQQTGIPALNQLGTTLSQLPGGIPGQVSIATEGDFILGAYTDRIGDRMSVQTVQSGNWGQVWNVTYSFTSAGGMLEDPQLAASPAGYFYGVWRDSAAGPWEVDLAVLSSAGATLLPSSFIPGAGGRATASAESPTILVDGLERPLVAWDSYPYNLTGNTTIQLTGGFLSPGPLSSILKSEYQSLTPSDYLDVVPKEIQTFRSDMNATFQELQQDITAKDWCNVAEIILPRGMFSNLTQLVVHPLAYANPFLSCAPMNVSYEPTVLAYSLGAFTSSTILSIEVQWLLESLGWGILPVPTWYGAPGGPAIPLAYGGNVPNPTTGAQYVDNAGDRIAVSPLVLNPNTVWLNTSGVFATFTNSTFSGCGTGGEKVSTVTVAPVNYSVFSQEYYVGGIQSASSVKVESFVGTFSSIPSVYLTNLSYDSWGKWNLSLKATYEATFNYTNGCGGNSTSRIIPIPAGMRSTYNITLRGGWNTTLDFLPRSPPMLISMPNATDPSQMVTVAQWNNTLEANVAASTVYSSNETQAGYQLFHEFRIAENVSLAGVSMGAGYTTSLTLNSQTGGTNYSWAPQLNANSPGQGAQAQMKTVSCTYTMPATDPTDLFWQASNSVTNVTETSALLTWYARGEGNGVAIYQERFGAAEAQGAVVTDLSGEPHPAGYPYRYTVQLDDLMPWAVYNVTIVVVVPDTSCHEFTNTAHWSFNTSATFLLQEEDMPVDSVRHVGGGAVLTWAVPAQMLGPSMSFKSGWLTLTNTSNTSDISVMQLNQTPYEVGPTVNGAGGFELNLSPSVGNQQYTVAMELNYTDGKNQYHGFSEPLTFWYQRDSSGDGLTDWEKERGWEVTTQNAQGAYQSRNVTANVMDYATNGITSDYIEKEFGLNPHTLDTAGSHMLDTWNLTFSLGPNASAKLPTSGFEFWYENTTYSFGHACPSPNPGQTCNFGAVEVNATNLTAAGPNNPGGDNSPWGAEVLWAGTGPNNALQQLEGLMKNESVSWLRAVTGLYNDNGLTLLTMTVWGKLSWGANPLASSSILGALPDGSRLSPLNSVDLQLTGLSSILGSTPCSNNAPSAGGSNGWAVQMELNDTNAVQAPELANYTTATNITSSQHCGSVWNYTVTVPVDNTEQFQHLDLRIIVNNSGTLVPLEIAGASTTASVSLDMFSAGSPTLQAGFRGSDGSVLSFYWQPVAAGAKSPTWLYVPTQNKTLNNLPWGLKRYIGEQSFELLVVNVPGNSTVTSDPITTAWNSSYKVTLQPRLNSFLVPRMAFTNDSSLGLGILLGRNLTQTTSSPTPAGLGSNELQAISFGGKTDLENLSCYWQNLSLATGSGALCSSEMGAGSGSASGIHVEADVGACSATNCGGIPGDAPAESTNLSAEGAALPAVLTLNISTSTQLDLLLAGLLDNTTGGVNGTLELVTSDTASLGFAKPVLTALANATYTSDGLYGVPTSIVPPPPPPPAGFWGMLWNTVTGAAIWLSGGIPLAGGFNWNPWAAAGSYFNHIGQGLANLAEQGLGAAASVLEAAGNKLLAALKAAWEIIVQEVEALFSAAISGWTAAQLLLQVQLNASLSGAITELQKTGSVTGSTAAAFWNLMGGSIFQIGVAVAAVVSTALTILAAVSMGSEEVVNLLVGLLLAVILSVTMSQLVSPSGQMVFQVESIYNNTTSQKQPMVGVQPMFSWCPGQDNQSSWGAVAQIFDWWELGLSRGYGAGKLYKAFGDTTVTDGEFELKDVAFGFALMGAALSAIKLAFGCVVPLSIAGMVLSGLGISIEFFELARGIGAPGASTAMDAVILGLGGIAFGTNFYEVWKG